MPDLRGWWRDFGSDELNQVIERVLEHNFDLNAAAARLQIAAAQARIAGADRQPQVGVGLNGGRQRQNFVGLPVPGGGSNVLTTTNSNFGVSLDISWELDLWGKLDAQGKAGLADFERSAADFEAARLSLAGQAAKAWLALVEASGQLEIAEARVDSFRESTEVLRGRFSNGRATALDLRLSESQLASSRAALSSATQNIERVSRELELLMGEYPDGSRSATIELPIVPQAITTGLPSELLQRRPDLVAARERLRADDYRLFAARKQLWPSLSLGAGAGRTTASFEDLLDDDFSVWNLVGNLTQPIFQGDRLDANIDLADAQVRASLAEYGSAILNAFLEVEIVLAIEEATAMKELEFELAAINAGEAQELAEERYFAGREDILTMISSRNTTYDNRSAWLSAKRERLAQRVDLYLALGGGFRDPAAEGTDPESNTDETLAPLDGQMETNASDTTEDSK